MTNLRQQLYEYIELSSNLIPEFDTSHLNCREAYQAGANDIAEMLIIACEALHQYGRSSVYVGSEDCNISVAFKALNKIQEMIKGKK